MFLVHTVEVPLVHAANGADSAEFSNTPQAKCRFAVPLNSDSQNKTSVLQS